MKVLVALVFLVVNTLPLSLLQGNETTSPKKSESVFLNLHLYHPISLFPDRRLGASLNFSLLYGRIRELRGLDLSVGASLIEEDMAGLQLGGLVAVAGHRSAGVQLAGLAAVSGDSGIGVQGGGLFAVAGNAFRGVQLGGLFAVSGDSGSGLQLSALFSVSGERFSGIQIGGLFGIAGNELIGLQLSALFNICGESCRGVQLGCINVAPRNQGLQIGLVNVDHEGEGVQLGLVNISGRGRTLPIGLVNLSKDRGSVSWTLWADGLLPVNMGFRFNFRRMYTLLGVGFSNSSDTGLCLSFHARAGIRFARRWSADLGYSQSDPSPLFKRSPGDGERRHVQFLLNRMLFSTKALNLTLGLGARYRIDDRSFFSGSPIQPQASLQLDVNI